MEDLIHFTVPKNFMECLSPVETAKQWRIWARRMALIGKVGIAVLTVWGVGTSIYRFWLAQGSGWNMFDFVLSMLIWGICAGILFCAFRILSLLFRSLANLFENVGVMSQLMVFQSAVDGYPDSGTEDSFQWKCGCCGAVNTKKD